MRDAVLFIGLFCLWVSPVLAAGAPTNIGRAEETLDITLSSLKESVARLTIENEQLTQTNNTLRARIKGMKNELSVLERDEARAQEQFRALEPGYERKKGNAQTLEAKSFEAERVAADLEAAYNKAMGELNAKEKEEKDLTARIAALESEIAALRNATAVEQTVDPELARLKAERDKLEVQVRDTGVSLAKVREEWLDLRRLTEGGPSQIDKLQAEAAETEARADALRQEIEKMKMALAGQEAFFRHFSSSPDANVAELASLDREVKVLADRAQALNRDWNLAQKERAARHGKAAAMRDGQRKKVEVKRDALRAKNMELRTELKNLRQAMIALDKKKMTLEKAAYPR